MNQNEKVVKARSIDLWPYVRRFVGLVGLIMGFTIIYGVNIYALGAKLTVSEIIQITYGFLVGATISLGHFMSRMWFLTSIVNKLAMIADYRKIPVSLVAVACLLLLFFVSSNAASSSIQNDIQLFALGSTNITAGMILSVFMLTDLLDGIFWLLVFYQPHSEKTE